MAKITYTNKVALNENPEIALINKVTDDDLNEIKSVVNTNDDNVGVLTNLTTTAKTNIVAAVNEVNSGKASSTDLGNIANLTTTDKTSAVNAINELNSDKAPDDIILVQSSEPTSADNILWINDGQIGTPASEITNSYSTSTGIGYSANYINNLKYQRLNPSDFITLNSGFSFGECNIYNYKNHYSGTMTILKNAKFTGNQEAVGTINSTLGTLPNNINTFGVSGATNDDRWSIPTNFAYVYITNANVVQMRGKTTDSYVKFNVDIILN